MSDKGKPAKADEPREYCVIIRRAGGGYTITEGTVPLSAVAVERTTAPDAFDFALGRLSAWLEQRWLRGARR